MSTIGMIIFTVLMGAFIVINLLTIRQHRRAQRAWHSVAETQQATARIHHVTDLYSRTAAAYRSGDGVEGRRLKAEAEATDV